MMHNVLLRFTASARTAHANVNDEIGLSASSNYSLSEYIEDRASEGVRVVSRLANHIEFSDGESGDFEETEFPILQGRL